jgi:hypothetical protein
MASATRSGTAGPLVTAPWGSLVIRREMLVADSNQGSLIVPGATADRRQVRPLDQCCNLSLSRSGTGPTGSCCLLPLLRADATALEDSV